MGSGSTGVVLVSAKRSDRKLTIACRRTSNVRRAIPRPAD